MLQAKAVRVKFNNFPDAYTPVIKCVEKGKAIWTTYLPVDYQYKEDALSVAEAEIERLKEYGL